MSEVYELVIAGSGPAGLTAAIYAARARIRTLVVEKNYTSGGQVLSTYEVDNYPGFPEISGMDLAKHMRTHAERFNVEFLEEEIIGIDATGEEKNIQTKKREIKAKAVILATGARHRLLGVPGEEEFSGMGVSYCATCDGAFFKEKTVFVAGGGDTALEEALFLSRICKKVVLVHRRDEFRGSKILQEMVFANSKIEILWNCVIEQIQGSDQVESVCVMNRLNQEKKVCDCNGIFVAVGTQPTIFPISPSVKISDDEYIDAGEDCITNVPGVFVAGDLRKKPLRQIVTALSDGANAVSSVEKYLFQYRN